MIIRLLVSEVYAVEWDGGKKKILYMSYDGNLKW